MKQQMKDKADAKSVVQVMEKLKNYASYADLQDLYAKVVP